MEPRYLPDLVDAHLDPVLAAVAVLCAVLCVGTVLSASWVVARARLMADPTEAGLLALGLFRWRSIPLAVASLGAGCAWLVRERPDLVQERFIVVAVGVVIALALVLRVSSQARRVAMGAGR